MAGKIYYKHYFIFSMMKRCLPATKCMISMLLVSQTLGCSPQTTSYTYDHGGITRGYADKKALSLVFTGDLYADGAVHIQTVLDRYGIKGSFFLTGNFYRVHAFEDVIRSLKEGGHYLGAHSDRHLLYCTWENRDSLLVTRDEFRKDVEDNYREMMRFGISREQAPYFMPPYEWFNEQISAWTEELGNTLVNFTPGTRSNADYTTPDMGSRYLHSDSIYQSILSYEQRDSHGLNGFLLLIHIGTAPERTDKFYLDLESLIIELSARGYSFERIDVLLKDAVSGS